MDVEFKMPPQENGTQKDDSSQETSPEPAETNGTRKESPKTPLKTKDTRKTRSRSRTPQNLKTTKNENNEEVKKLSVNLHKIDEEMNVKHSEKDLKNPNLHKIDEEMNVNDSEKDLKHPNENEKTEAKEDTVINGDQKKKEETEKSEKKAKIEETTNKLEPEAVEMDALVLVSDEPDPELQFDENSDKDSGKGSPVQGRCITRRSQTRNIPTPKTPKPADSESEKNSVAPTPDPIEPDSEQEPENLNDTNDSIDDGDNSTRVEAGGDATRLDFIKNYSSMISEDTSYLNSSRERSVGETLRNLSSRRPIRAANQDYRKRALRNNQEKSDLNLSYPVRNSVEQISGVKRSRSITPTDDRKKFKSDSPGLVSLFSSPLNNLKNRFRSDLASSTPKLMGYKDCNQDFRVDRSYEGVTNGIVEDKKTWCSIM